MTDLPSEKLPAGVRLGNHLLLQVTQSAITKIQSLIKRDQTGNYLRIAITGGGCNGLTYKTRFTHDLKSGDILIRVDNATLVIDSKSALYLKGSKLDYSHKMIAGGFKFTNPNAKSSCSCGESFSL